MLLVKKVKTPEGIDLLPNELVEKNWSKKVSQSRARTFFDSKIYCGFIEEGILNIFDYTFKKYQYLKEVGTDKYFAIGTMVLIHTLDDYYVVCKRSNKVIHAPGHVTLPGGYLSPNGSELNDLPSLRHLASIEIFEEINLDIKDDWNIKLFANKFNPDSNSYHLYFYYKSSYTKHELEAGFQKNDEVDQILFLDNEHFYSLGEDNKFSLSVVLENVIACKEDLKQSIDKCFANDILFT